MSAKPHTAHTLCVLTSLHLLPKGTCVDVAMTATLGERERERERALGKGGSTDLLDVI